MLRCWSILTSTVSAWVAAILSQQNTIILLGSAGHDAAEMAQNNRSQGRDVLIWDLADTEHQNPLGGLILGPGITNTDFRQMLDILLTTSRDCHIQNARGEEVLRNDQPLMPGDYFVAADKIAVINEMFYTRAHSITTGTRTQAFREAVQARDGRCVVSKVKNHRATRDLWAGFEAAHIFPLAYEQQWVENNYSRWTAIQSPQGGSINSVQNGILLQSNLHQEFYQYLFSINPDVSLFFPILFYTHYILLERIQDYLFR
jgi:hypothetical protein